MNNEKCEHEFFQREDKKNNMWCRLCGYILEDMCGQCKSNELLDNGMCLDIPK